MGPAEAVIGTGVPTGQEKVIEAELKTSITRDHVRGT